MTCSSSFRSPNPLRELLHQYTKNGSLSSTSHVYFPFLCLKRIYRLDTLPLEQQDRLFDERVGLRGLHVKTCHEFRLQVLREFRKMLLDIRPCSGLIACIGHINQCVVHLENLIVHTLSKSAAILQFAARII